MIINAVNDPNIQPINRGGTGATTAEEACTNLGIADYIVDCGISGDWIYEKRASGKAVAIRRTKLSNLAINIAKGNLYCSAYWTWDYPSGLFVEVPSPFPSLNLTSENYVIGLQVGNNTVDQIQLRATCTPSLATSVPTINLYVVGKWK